MKNEFKRKNYMKKIVLILILFFCFNVFALNLDTNSVKYFQGETLYFFGSCTPNTELQITALNEIKKVFFEKINCSYQGKYFFEFNSSFIDPSGKWVITLDSVEGSVKKVVDVLPVRESSFYLISFLSPPSREISKASDLDLVVKVTDKGTPVNNAEVYFFDLFGEKKKMDFVSDGIYSFKYELPFNIETEFWNLLVLAQKENEITIGGSNEINLSLIDALISIEFIEPLFDSYDLSLNQRIPIKIKASYLDGKPVINPNITLTVNNKNFQFTAISENEFYFDFIPEITDLGSVVLMVNARDTAGNVGNNSKVIQTKGELIFILKQNILLILLISIVLIGIILMFSNKFILTKSLKSLELKEKELIQKIKSLQEDYFLNQKINPIEYKKILAEYNSKLALVKKKLSDLKK
jgi:hypothetical protein